MGKTLILLWLLSNSQLVLAKSSEQVTKKKCAGIAVKIEQVNDRLRAGYRAAQGEKLKNKLRKLKQTQYACRQKRLPVD